MIDAPVIQVIRREDLRPGDFILVKAPQDKMKVVAEWADMFFKGTKCRVGVILPEMEIRVVGSQQESHEP
jgi:hypothetical protein